MAARSWDTMSGVAKRVWAWWVLSILSLTSNLIHGIIYYSRMPDVVPTRFNTAGQVAETGSKNELFAIYTCSAAVVSLVMGAIALTVCLCDTGVGLPNRAFWLHESRRMETFSRFSRMILVMWALTNLLLMWIFDEVFRFGLACMSEMGDLSDLNDARCAAEQSREMWWPWVGMAAYIIPVILIPYIEKRRWEREATRSEEASHLFFPSDINSMWENSANWKLGMFYYCPADHRMFVPKRMGLGWTVNLASFTGQALCIFIVGIVMVMVVVTLGCSADPKGCGGL